MKKIRGAILLGLCALILAVNIEFLKSPTIGILGLFVYIILLSWLWGKDLPGTGKAQKFLWGFWGSLSALTGSGAITYFFYRINDLVVLLALFLMPAASIALSTALKKESSIKKGVESPSSTGDNKKNKDSFLSVDWKTIPWLVVFIGCVLYGFRLLAMSVTDAAIRSPFDTVKPGFFLFFFLAAFALSWIHYSNSRLIRYASSAIFLFLAFSLGLIIYKVGFGFDPFIHQATEKLILEKGSVDPKPLYYLGQYFLVVFLSRVSLLPTALIDTLLVPLLSSLLIPAFILTLKRAEEKYQLATRPELLLILPFSAFTLTTPQSLGNLFTLLVVLGSLQDFNTRVKWFFLALAALASLSIHPLAGLPALIFLFLAWLVKTKLSNALKTAGLVFTGLLVPMVFLVQARLNQQLDAAINLFQAKNFGPALMSLMPSWPRYFDWRLDIAYFWNKQLYLLLLIIAAVALTAVRRSSAWAGLRKYPLTFLALLANYLLLSGWISFPFLIEYERGDFARRLLEMSFYFLVPLLLVVGQMVLSKTANLKTRAAGSAFFSFLILNSLYFSYPRQNQFEPGHQVSTSKSDLDAVEFIEQVSSGPYVVLADQSVSAAALKILGFNHYYKTPKGEIYFYPIPTGGPLYRYFLSMVYERPSRKTMKEAAGLAGVNEAFFVINDYWDGYQGLSETAKAEADKFWSLDREKVQIFEYKF